MLEKSTKKLQAKLQHSCSNNCANDPWQGSNINTEALAFYNIHSLISHSFSLIRSLTLFLYGDTVS